MNNFSQTYSEQSSAFLKAKKSIGIANNSATSKILVQGEEALHLINSLSLVKVDELICANFFTVFFKGRKIYCEVLVLRLSMYRYLVISSSNVGLLKLLKSKMRKYRSTIISDSSNFYSLFSFHGASMDKFFGNEDYHYLYKTTRQNYSYYHLLTKKIDESKIANHFLGLNFIPLSLDVERLFLYNNNVILDIDKIKNKYRLSVCKELYPLTPSKRKIRKIKLQKLELVGNYLVAKKDKLYSGRKKLPGIIHCCYQLLPSENPFVIVINTNYRNPKISKVKIGKTEVLVNTVFTS